MLMSIMASNRRIFKLDRVEIFHGISLPETHILFYSNGLAIEPGLPDIRHIKIIFIGLKNVQAISLPETAHFVL